MPSSVDCGGARASGDGKFRGSRADRGATLDHWCARVESRRDEPEQVINDRQTNIHNPTLTVFLPLPEKATGAAVVIAPGGGHAHLADVHEGYRVAEVFAEQGVAAFVLKYRLAKDRAQGGKLALHRRRACPDRCATGAAAGARAGERVEIESGGDRRAGVLSRAENWRCWPAPVLSRRNRLRPIRLAAVVMARFRGPDVSRPHRSPGHRAQWPVATVFYRGRRKRSVCGRDRAVFSATAASQGGDRVSRLRRDRPRLRHSPDQSAFGRGVAESVCGLVGKSGFLKGGAAGAR